jgi:hypothetical protein
MQKSIGQSVVQKLRNPQHMFMSHSTLYSYDRRKNSLKTLIQASKPVKNMKPIELGLKYSVAN